jgi:hypothetical protein
MVWNKIWDSLYYPNDNLTDLDQRRTTMIRCRRGPVLSRRDDFWESLEDG